MSTAVERIIVHEAELQRPKTRGRYLYAYCHIHGSDHQQSLHINAENGFGKCHACGVHVFVPELNPDEEARRARGQGRGPYAPRRITPAALLRPVKRQAEGEPTPAEWQRAEVAALTSWYPRMRERLKDDRARAYLEGRGIPWEIADGAGVGYVPAEARLPGPLAKWRDRLVFPLGSPAGTGYAGRSLHGWQPGMDENAHKALLEADPEHTPRRWEKTYPAGWLGYGALASASSAVLCEGPLDALALLAAGLCDVPVVALVGTAGRAHWIPDSVARVVLALDGDGPGRKAAHDLAHELRTAGLVVTPCAPPLEDGQGKDWAERWRLAEWEGVAPVFDALDGEPDAQASTVVIAVDAPAARREPSHNVPNTDDMLAVPWLADLVIRRLQAHGLELAEARMLAEVPTQPALLN